MMNELAIFCMGLVVFFIGFISWTFACGVCTGLMSAFTRVKVGDISTDHQEYMIYGPDFSRSSRMDEYVRNHLWGSIKFLHGGKCAHCHRPEHYVEGSLELDHFWQPKSKGGNFIMRHLDGVFVCNIIPLCRSCNASKGAKSLKEFFSLPEIGRLMAISVKITNHINNNREILTNLKER